MSLPAPLPRLCAITDLARAGVATQEEAVSRLVAAGARWVQARGASEPESAWAADLGRARRAAAGAGALFIVNDRPDLAILSEADGVHLGSADVPVAAARRVLGPGAVIGVSTHSVEEAAAAASLAVDYVAIGPVFDSPTKPSRDTGRAPLGLAAVTEARRRVGVPLVAIGGITLERAAAVRAAGADAVAVISDLYREDDLAARLAAFLAALGDPPPGRRP